MNTGLAALLGGSDLRWYVAAAGIVFALTWWWLLRSYRKLSWTKYEVINSIERRLPYQLFPQEWQYLESTQAPRRLWPPRDLRGWASGYHELGAAERIVPVVFVGIYLVELIRQVTRLSYIDELAGAVRSAVPSDLIPDGDTSRLFRIHAVLALAKGENVVLEEIHDAWHHDRTGVAGEAGPAARGEPVRSRPERFDSSLE